MIYINNLRKTLPDRQLLEIENLAINENLSLIHISEPTRREWLSRMPSSA